MASVAVDLNQQRSDSSLASKSTRPLGQMIGSIPGDNLSDKKICDAVVKCNHFSIRGYVAEVRKKDPKLCDPFPSYVNHDGSMETSHELPPMVVPKFRWWQCDHCVPEAGSSEGTGKEPQKSADEANANVSLIKQKSKADVPRERNTEASTSTDSNDNRNDTPSSTMHADLKGKGKAHVEDEPTPHTGCENGFLKDSLSHDIQQQTAGGIEASGFADNEGVRRSQYTGNGNIEFHQMNHRPDTIEIGPSKERLNHENGNSNQTSPLKAKASLEALHASALTKCVGTQVAGIVDGPSGDGKGRVVSLPDLNEFNGEPSDDDENEVLATGNSNLCEEDDDGLGAERRKTPKVRLLSELLSIKEKQNDAKLKKKNPSFSSFQGPSAWKSTVSDSPGPSSMNENAKRKRAGSQDEDSKSVEIKGSNNGTKKLRTPQIEISESESEDESTEIISEALTKRRNRSTPEKIPFSEKRSKKIKFDHGTPSMPRHKITSKSNQEKGKPPEKRVSVDAATLKPSQCDVPRKNDSSAQVDDRNFILAKAKGKIIQAGKEQTSFAPSKNHVLRDSTTTGKDKEAIKSGNEHVLNEQSQDRSPGKGTYLFPDRYLTMGTDHMRIAPGKNGFYPHPSQADHTLLNGGVVIKHTDNRNTGVTNISFKTPGSAPFMGNRFDAYTEKSTGPKSNSKGRPVLIPEIGEGGHLVHHSLKQVSNSVNNQKELTNEVQRRIQDIDINSLPTDDKVPEQGYGDDYQDIPMDIVELMAKNQYERNLSDPKDNQHPVSLAANYGKTVRSNGSSSSAYGENMSKLELPCFLSMQNPITTNARNSMVNGFEDMGSSRLKLLGPFSDLNQNHIGIIGHVRENQVSAMSLSSGQGHEHVSAYSALESTPNNWNRHMTTQRYPPTNFFQPVDSYNRYRASSPRPNIDAHVWPSMVANRMPLGITNPEMISQSSKSMSKGRMHHQGPSILNFSAVNLGKQNMNFSNAYSSGPVESSGSGARPSGRQRGADYPPKSMGSVDLYSNDAIPAMHLLSLMQNAAKMQPAAPLSIDGKAALLKRPPNLPDHQYKQHTGTHETGPIKVGPSGLRQPLLENNGRTSMQENSCHPCYPALPPAHPFASPFQNDGGYGRNSGFISPIPLTSRGQRNIESSHFISPGGDHRSQKSVACDVVRKRPFSSAIDKGKGLAGVSSPLQPSKDSSNFLYGVATRRDDKSIHRSPDKEICVVNRNPSEFNDLKELSRYTIRPEDLRPGGASREKPARPRGDAKRLEMRMNKPMSIPSGKERDRQRKP